MQLQYYSQACTHQDLEWSTQNVEPYLALLLFPLEIMMELSPVYLSRLYLPSFQRLCRNPRNAPQTWNLGSVCGRTIRPDLERKASQPIMVAKHVVQVQSVADLSLDYHITNV